MLCKLAIKKLAAVCKKHTRLEKITSQIEGIMHKRSLLPSQYSKSEKADLQHEIFRLDIPMDDAIAVTMLQDLQDNLHHQCSLPFG